MQGWQGDCRVYLRHFWRTLALSPLAAVRTKIEIRGHWPATLGADPSCFVVERPGLRSTGGIKNPPAPVAFQECLPPLDGDEGNEKKAQVMVQPFEPGRGQATLRTGTRLILYLDLLGLHTADEDEDAPPLEPFPQRLFNGSFRRLGVLVQF